LKKLFSWLKIFTSSAKVRKVGAWLFVFAIISGLFLLGSTDIGQANSTKKNDSASVLSYLTSMQQYVVSLLSWIVYGLVIYPLGWFIIMLFNVLTAVASYNEFLSSAAVVKGWVVVRDIANMSIIIFLLVIAFGIMLRVESYGNRKLLARLLLMAVLVNFSKTICGFFIDISQVIMLTFVNGFKFITGASLVRSMQLDEMMRLGKPTDGNNITLLKSLAALVLSALFMFTILAVIVVILMTLIWRIVNLWMLVVLSPLAFLGSAVPFLQSFYNDWYKKFLNFLINGPLLAFFLWLALTIMNGLQQVNSTNPTDQAASGIKNAVAEAGDTLGEQLTQAFTGGNILILLISIGLLVGSLVLSAGFGAVMAGKAVGMLKSGTVGALKKGLKYTAKAQDTALGVTSSALFGRNLSVGRAVTSGKRAATRQLARAGQWYHEAGQRSAETGGVVGMGFRAVANRMQGGSLGTGSLQGSIAETRERKATQEAQLQNLEQQEAFMKSAGAVGGLMLQKGNTIDNADLAKKLGVNQGTEVTDALINERKEALSSSWVGLDSAQQESLKTDLSSLGLGVTTDRVDLISSSNLSDSWVQYASGDTQLTAQVEAARGKVEGTDKYYAKLRDIAASKQTSYEYITNKRSAAAYAQKAQGVLTELIPKEELNNEAEIARLIQGYFGTQNGKAMTKHLLKVAADQGMLKAVLEKTEVNIDGKIQKMDNNPEALNRLLGNGGNHRIQAGDVEFMQEIAKISKKEGNTSLADMVTTDPVTGEVLLTHRLDVDGNVIDMKDIGSVVDQQIAAMLSRAEKGQLTSREIDGMAVGSDGDLSLFYKEYLKKAADREAKRYQRGNMSAATSEVVKAALANPNSAIRTEATPSVKTMLDSFAGELNKAAGELDARQLQQFVKERDAFIKTLNQLNTSPVGSFGSQQAKSALNRNLDTLRQDIDRLNQKLGYDTGDYKQRQTS
jgi:hypothetical protein